MCVFLYENNLPFQLLHGRQPNITTVYTSTFPAGNILRRLRSISVGFQGRHSFIHQLIVGTTSQPSLKQICFRIFDSYGEITVKTTRANDNNDDNNDNDNDNDDDNDDDDNDNNNDNDNDNNNGNDNNDLMAMMAVVGCGEYVLSDVRR